MKHINTKTPKSKRSKRFEQVDHPTKLTGKVIGKQSTRVYGPTIYFIFKEQIFAHYFHISQVLGKYEQFLDSFYGARYL